MREARIALENAQLVLNRSNASSENIRSVSTVGNHMQEASTGTVESGNVSTNTTTSNEQLSSPKQNNLLAAGEDLQFFHCNLRGFATNSPRVVAAIRLRARKPHIVFLNETLTDESDKSFKLEGYELIYKGDRCKGGGGIAVFARSDVAFRVTLLEKGDDERCWITIHSEEGPYLGCCWYRPPVRGELESILRFKNELLKHRATGIGTIIIGDINVIL